MDNLKLLAIVTGEGEFVNSKNYMIHNTLKHNI